jgi:hypothetical protein
VENGIGVTVKKGIVVLETRPVGLSEDTAVKRDGSIYKAEVGLRWDNFGRPVGAILAGAMVRAASEEAGMSAVVSTTTEFLNRAQIGEAEIICEVVRQSSVLCCVKTLAVQEDRKICQGTTWLSTGHRRHSHFAAPPEVPDWSAVPTADERVGPGNFAFSGVLEQRPLVWIDDFARRPESAPCNSMTWVRFTPGSSTRDLVTKACEVLVVGDLNPPMTMIVASPRYETMAVGAQTIALSAHLGSLEDDSEHLLIETSVECLSGIVLTGVARVWTERMALRGLVTASYRISHPRPLRPASNQRNVTIETSHFPWRHFSSLLPRSS